MPSAQETPYIPPNSSLETYKYKVDFSADIIIKDSFLTERTLTLAGDMNFYFRGDSEDYFIDGYQYETIRHKNDFTQEAKDGASFIFQKMTEN